MKFLFDHDVPDELAHFLRQMGHQVSLLRESLATNAPDQEVFSYAQNHGCLLVTCNRDDFLELASGQKHCGLIILVRRRSRVAERVALIRLIQQAGQQGLSGNINFS